MRNVFTRLLTGILLAVLLVQSVPVTAQAAGGKGSVELIRPRSSAKRFNTDDDGLWFPGDSESRVYEVRTVHTKKTPLYFSVEVTADSALKEALWMTVYVAGSKEYDGLLSDFPAQLTHTLGAKETRTEYDIRFSLATSTGNSYRDLDLEADFIWKYEKDDGKVEVLENPKTGNRFPLEILVAIMASSVIFLICLLLLRKKEKKEEAP